MKTTTAAEIVSEFRRVHALRPPHDTNRCPECVYLDILSRRSGNPPIPLPTEQGNNPNAPT